MPSRRITQCSNAFAALFAVGASTAAALLGVPPGVRARAPEQGFTAGRLEPTRLPDGNLALPDATGALVPLVPRHRIVSGSLLADPLLLELCAPSDIVAFSARAPVAHDAYRYVGKPSLDPTRRLEHLLELKPDLVLVNSLGEHAWIEQLRGAGVVVFDLGPMWGVETFLRNVDAIGWLVGRSDAARELASRFRRRLGAVARHLGAEQRRGALYVGVHGNDLLGGTRGSSFHDVLEHAGLVDVAAQRYRGWPSYDPEALLTLDPEVVVTQLGMRRALCERAELGRLRACGTSGQVIEIEAWRLNDAGLGILDAAEEVHQAAYPAPGAAP
jgi:iron complex transport system substrate-binding protein